MDKYIDLSLLIEVRMRAVLDNVSIKHFIITQV